MASVYQTQEWRQGGGPARQEHPLHTDLGGGSGQRDPNSSQGIARLKRRGGFEALGGHMQFVGRESKKSR